MPLVVPPEFTQILDRFDTRADTFELAKLADALRTAVRATNELTPEQRRGCWAEWAAINFDVHPGRDGGPWKTYFQPASIWTMNDGSETYGPDLREADAEVVAYWGSRAKGAKHPVLAARYADLVWDTTKFVTEKRPKIDFAHIAIDSYIAALKLDNGDARGENHYNLVRMMKLALSIGDRDRITRAVDATFDYNKRTADSDTLANHCELFDNLLPADGGPQLTKEQEGTIIDDMESRFSERTEPGGQWEVDPHSAKELGDRLASYYQRKARPIDRQRVLKAVAGVFERRGHMGDALSCLIFLQEARDIYLEAGLRDDAERVQQLAQQMGPKAEQELVPLTVEHEIPNDTIEQFRRHIMEGGLDRALIRFGVEFLPNPESVAEQVEQTAADAPVFGIMFEQTKKIGEGHIEADVGDDSGDPDGKSVHRTAYYMQLASPWIAWGLDELVKYGLTTAKLCDFVFKCELFTDDRRALISRAIEAHFSGDFTTAIHLIVPQIERAVVNTCALVGKPTNKGFQTGRGVMQLKNLNDVLAKDGWAFGAEMENLRLYLLSVLAHPKGMNIRNEVSHGIWPSERFTEAMSERLVHVLMVVSLLRPLDESEKSSSSSPTAS
jgi:uncharacterized protein DUF4209